MKYIQTSKYFYGKKLTDEELERGYISYATLASCFDAVLCNNIASNIFEEGEQVNGFIDYSDEINDAEGEIESIEEMQNEQDNPPEVYQWFIISDNGAEILNNLTDEIVYYLPSLDVYVWGVCHWGTSWASVSTDIRIEFEEGNK